MAIDIIATLLASATALLFVQLLFKPAFIPHPSRFAAQWMVASLVVSFIAFYIFKTHHLVIRHFTLREVGHILLATLQKSILMSALLCIHPYFTGWHIQQTTLVVLDTLLTLTLLILVRVAMITAYDIIKRRLTDQRHKKQILIYGTGYPSVAMAQQLQDGGEYNIVGFTAYGTKLRNHTINEHPVFYFRNQDNLYEIRDRYDIDAILFTSPADARDEQERLISFAAECNIRVLIIPSIDEVIDGRVKVDLREIKIEDLLMRPEIEISMEKIRQSLTNRRVLVTGAAGSIGSELCRQIATLGIEELILVDNAETPMHNIRLELEEKFPSLKFTPVVGDVRYTSRMDFIFRTYRPHMVFHAAAYKHVPLMEENPCEAVLVNVIGSRNIANKCLKYGVEKMVMISTDKAVNPTNIMGTTKRLAEIYVQSLGLAIARGEVEGSTKFVTTRFGNVLGSNGSVIPRFREQIANGGPLTVTHPEITRFFMTIPEACRLVMEAANMSEGNEIFVFDMGKSVRIADLARHMIKLAGYIPDKDIAIKYTGLRPGEKLYEEVLANEENTSPTSHGRIRIAKVRDISYSEANAIIGELERMATHIEIDDMVRLMKRTVPEYTPENSRYTEIV